MEKIYVENENKLVYEVAVKKVYENYMELELTLVCGYDYINPDMNDIQGYIKAENFVERVQNVTEICYYWTEGIESCLIENGYTVVKKLPKIY